MGAAYRFVTMLTKFVISASLLWVLMLPMMFVGLTARLLWDGLIAGWRSDDDFIDWLTGDVAAWRVKVKPPTTEGGHGGG